VQKQAVFASIEMLDAFRYGKIIQPLTHSATEKSTSPCRVPLRKNQRAAGELKGENFARSANFAKAPEATR
jgi:hypothetical protein